MQLLSLEKWVKCWRCLFAVILVLNINTSNAQTPSNVPTAELSFAIVPQQSASRLARVWGPILQYLSLHTGKTMVFRTAPNIPEFERRLARGDYDVAYMNPYHYIQFHELSGYTAFAKQENKQIKGILVTHKDSSISSVHDLQGKNVAFPAPAAFAATLLPKAFLNKHGINVTSRYVSSHDSVYANVAKQIYVAGGGIERTFNKAHADDQKNLRILWKSEGYTPHAFAYHSRVAEADIVALQSAMVNMRSDVKGRELISNLGFEGIVAANNEDWNDIRQLNIDQLPADD